MRKLNSSNFLWGAYRRPKKEEKDDFKKWIWDRRSEEMKSGLEKKNYIWSRFGLVFGKNGALGACHNGISGWQCFDTRFIPMKSSVFAIHDG